VAGACVRGLRNPVVVRRMGHTMLARAFPLLFLSACASAPPVPMPAQPDLAALARPYAQQLQAVGITRLTATAGNSMVELTTLSGPVYVRYPKDVPAFAFELDVGPDGVRAFSTGFDKTRDAAVLNSILPQAIRATATNNAQVWIHSNPWN
jgi:hypothetical protein